MWVLLVQEACLAVNFGMSSKLLCAVSIGVHQIIPKISVLLPVYNGVPWVSDAIRCVLAQTFSDFELIVIDDGSRDDSWGAINAFADPRIRAFRQSNKGLAATLNVGLGLASAPYVARQDQDDWMHPERLERQYAFIEAKPDCIGVGTWAEIRVNDQPSGRFHHHPTEWDALNFFLMFDNPFVHSSMLLRRDAVLAVGGYSEDPGRQPPEDYELWSRMASVGTLANIGEALTAYREVAGSMSRTGPNPFLEKVVKIGAENLHSALRERFSMDKCLALAACYHGTRGDHASVSLLDVFGMLGALRDGLVDALNGPSDEFEVIYRRIRLLLLSRIINQYDIFGLLKVYRGLRRRLRNCA